MAKIMINPRQLMSSAPWSIPDDCQINKEQKDGYLQIKFIWQKDGWNYEARWHEKTPLAKIITWPSWRLDRIKPGKGYGPNHAHRISQTKVGKKWLPTSKIRYAAFLVNHGQASEEQIRILKKAHFN